MADRDTLFFKTPATCHSGLWKEALPVGNGKIGAGILGGVKFETIYINRNDLWHWGKRDILPDVSYHLQETRKLLDDNRFREANDILTRELSGKGYGPQFFVPMTLGDLAIVFHKETLFSRYRRMLKMDTGEAIVQYRQDGASVCRRAFLSRADDMLVYEIISDSDTIGMDISLQIHDDYQEGTVRMKEEMAPSLQIKVKNKEITYSAHNEDQTDFGMILRILDCDGKVKKTPNQLVISDASRVLLVLKTFAKEKRSSALERLSGELDKLYSCSYEVLLERHEAAHRPLYESAGITFGDDVTPSDLCNEELLLKAYEKDSPCLLLEKLWKFGRYLFISGTDPSGLPFPLYGLWHGEYALPWTHHMANENIQMIYWHAAAGGLVDFLKALIEYYYSMLDDFRENARKLFGCRGIYISAGTVPGLGLASMMVPVIANWIAAAGWIGQHFYTYYQYTGDKDILKNRILPFLYETALFYEDYLVMDEEKGVYKIYPSVSPENTPGNLNGENFQHMAHACPTAVNATMDIAIIKEVLQNLIHGAEETGCYQEEIPRWQNMLRKLPPYLNNPDGSIKEWSYDGLEDFNYHRHLSHLYPVFPGTEVTGEKNKELLQEFELSINKRILGGQTGWSLAHMSNLYCRLNQPQKALECLDIMTRSCLLTNFFTLHNDWRRMGLTLDLENFTAIQLDALMGAVNALQEMLLFAEEGYVKILPCLPERFVTGKFHALHFPKGDVSAEWNQKTGRLQGEIRLNSNADIAVDFPEKFGGIEVDAAGCKVCCREKTKWHICGGSESRIHFHSI